MSNVAGAVGRLISSEIQTFKGADNTYLHALPLFLKGNKFRGYVQLFCLKFCFVFLISPYIVASCNDEQMTNKLNELAIFAVIYGCC
jgi:hypothetical protein